MAQLAIYLLGSFQARLNEQTINPAFKTEKERALLAYLALETERSHRRETLGELLWPNRPEGVARANLRQALSRLRGAVQDQRVDPGFFLTSNETIQLNPESTIWVDTGAFRKRVQNARRHAHCSLPGCAACAGLLQEAVDLYRGNFLCDLGAAQEQEFEEWIQVNREQYFQDFLFCLYSLSLHYMETRDYERGLAYAKRHLKEAPLEERAHRQVMRLLTLQGRRNAALEHYEHTVQLVRKDLQADPAPETTELYQQIKSGKFTQPLPPTPAVELPPVRLPQPITGFIGREKELGSLVETLRNPAFRLINLFGMPGVGKTRLAVEAATLCENYHNRVCFVDLNDIHTREEMLKKIGGELGLGQSSRLPAIPELAAAVNGRPVLLVLDGFEKLTGETSLLVELLHLAPALKLLLTSRKRLNYQAALEIELEGLPYPDKAMAAQALIYPAVQLFINRARVHQSGFHPDMASLPWIGQISQLLGGNPMAIELAAFRLRDLNLEQLAQGLSTDLGLLQTRLADIPERQRSMVHIFEEMWKGLRPRERNALRRLAVFPAHFSAQAAREICGVETEVLAYLCDNCLITCQRGEGCCWHPLLHQFAAWKLSAYSLEVEELNERHTRFYLAVLKEKEGMLRKRQEVTQTLAALEMEHANIEAALQWAITHQYEAAAEYAACWSAYQALSSDLEQAKFHIPSFGESAFPFQGELIENIILSPALMGEEACCGRTGMFEDALRAIFLMDEEEVICSANYQAAQLCGYTLAQLRGLPLSRLLPGLDALEPALMEANPVELLRRDMQHVSVYLKRSEICVGEQCFLLAILVEQRDLTAGEVESIHLVDPLTGLPNREGFLQKLRERLSRAARETCQVAVLLLDIDNLKTINESLGPDRGDEILQMISNRLQRRRRGTDFLARLGSDEFALLLDNPPGPKDMLNVAERILSEITRPFELAGETLQIAIHIGISFYPEGGDNAEGLIQNADIAIREARQQGQLAYIFPYEARVPSYAKFVR